MVVPPRPMLVDDPGNCRPIKQGAIRHGFAEQSLSYEGAFRISKMGCQRGGKSLFWPVQVFFRYVWLQGALEKILAFRALQFQTTRQFGHPLGEWMIEQR